MSCRGKIWRLENTIHTCDDEVLQVSFAIETFLEMYGVHATKTMERPINGWREEGRMIG